MGMGKKLIGAVASTVAFAGVAAADCVTRENGKVVADNRFSAAFAKSECKAQHDSVVRGNRGGTIVTKMKCSSGGCADAIWVHNGRGSSGCARKDCKPGYQ